MIKKIISTLFSFISFFTFAQYQDSIPTIKHQRPKHILSLSLLSQLDINSPSIQLAYDLKLTNTIGLHQELGYVNNWLNPFYSLAEMIAASKNKSKNGLKYIFEPRIYPFSKGDKLFSSRIFFAPSFNFKYIHINRDEWLSRNNSSYTQKLNFNIEKLVYGASLKFGFTSKLRRKRPIDMVFGIGFKYASKYTNAPADAEVISNYFIPAPSIRGNQWHPDLSFSLLLHISYFIKKQ